LLPAILLPVTQKVIPSLTCTSITACLSQRVLDILSPCIVLLLVAHHGLSSWIRLRLSCKVAARHSAACCPADHSLPDLHNHHFICESVRVIPLIIKDSSAACNPAGHLTRCMVHVLSSWTEHYMTELLQCKSRQCLFLGKMQYLCRSAHGHHLHTCHTKSKGSFVGYQKAVHGRQRGQLRGKVQYLCRSFCGHHLHTCHTISTGSFVGYQKAVHRRQMRQLKGQVQYLGRSAHGHYL